jgi:pilus assembly protein CpaF
MDRPEQTPPAARPSAPPASEAGAGVSAPAEDACGPGDGAQDAVRPEARDTATPAAGESAGSAGPAKGAGDGAGPMEPPAAAAPRRDTGSSSESRGGAAASAASGTSAQEDAEDLVRRRLYVRIDPAVAVQMSEQRLRDEVRDLVGRIANEENLRLNWARQAEVAERVIDDMLGIGPVQPLLADDSVNDILVNGPGQIYVERRGQLELTGYRFRDEDHLMNVAQRIAAGVGRRIDEASPMVDARLKDGSRVNIVIPPLALNGVCISIRKFNKGDLTLDDMVWQENLSRDLAQVLQIAAASRLNVVISGGTGSGKTTLLNAMSRLIDVHERIVTIEDTAELRLQQPHVVRLETRPPNLEGEGEVTQRDLVRNALRMRPDRIIVGESRGAEAFDMLQAMNTGHDGSLSTLHANSPRDALARLENMVLMATSNLPISAIRSQIVGAVDLIVQIERMRDGKRRVVSLTEVAGQEGDVITTQDLMLFDQLGEANDGSIQGTFRSTGSRPHFMPRAEKVGLGQRLARAMST